MLHQQLKWKELTRTGPISNITFDLFDFRYFMSSWASIYDCGCHTKLINWFLCHRFALSDSNQTQCILQFAEPQAKITLDTSAITWKCTSLSSSGVCVSPLVVHLAGVELTPEGRVWLERNLAPDQTVWFKLISREDNILHCLVSHSRVRNVIDSIFAILLIDEWMKRNWINDNFIFIHPSSVPADPRKVTVGSSLSQCPLGKSILSPLASKNPKHLLGSSWSNVRICCFSLLFLIVPFYLFTVDQTKQEICPHHLGLWELTIWHFVTQTIHQ